MLYRMAEQGGPAEDLPDVLARYDSAPERIGGEMVTIAGYQIQHTQRWAEAIELQFGLITVEQYERLRDWTRPAVHGFGPFELYEGNSAPILVNIVEVPKPRWGDLIVGSMVLREV